MEVLIEKIDNLGRGICKIDNIVCFVDKTLPNDLVEIKVIKEKKNYKEGKLIKIIKPSKVRINSPCPYFDLCGGCSFLNTTYDNELLLKEKNVKEILSKYGNIDEKLIKNTISINKDNYRNKVVFQVKNNKIGFYKSNSLDLVEIDYCLLLDDEINNLIPLLKKGLTNKTKKITIKVSNDSKYKMLVIEGGITNIDDLLKKVDVLIVDDKKFTDKDYIITKIFDNKFILGKDSFLQINKYLTEDLYQKIIDYVKLKRPKKVLDLYCGIGTISSSISKYVENVTAIEVSNEAIKNAIISAKLNSINNIKFINAKVEEKLNVFTNDVDLLIVDPPRSGLKKEVIKEINNSNISNMIYISCNPITLTRDLIILQEKYNIKDINIYNMFLHTYHCETIAILERK